MELRVNSVPAVEDLGRLLREARERADLSQRELAERLGVAARTIQYWESGKLPRPAHRRRIRAFLEAATA